MPFVPVRRYTATGGMYSSDTECRTTYSLNAKVPPLGRPLATFPCRFPVAGVRHVVRVWRNHGSPVDHTSAHVLAHRRCQHLVAPPLRCFVGDVPEHAQEPLEHLYLGLVGRVKLRRFPCAGPIDAARASEKCGVESWFGAHEVSAQALRSRRGCEPRHASGVLLGRQSEDPALGGQSTPRLV